jgi:transcriptional regulator with XRE-family HTH domain
VPKLPRLRAIRHRKALSQRDLAAAAGVTPATIARLESGEVDARHVTVRKLARALGVEPADLMEPLDR